MTNMLKNILEPLEIGRSFFRKEEVDADVDVATPYIITRNGECIKSEHPYGISADGGLISNVIDLTHYIIMFLNRGKIWQPHYSFTGLHRGHGKA